MGDVFVLPNPDARIRALEEWIEGIKSGQVFDCMVIGYRVGHPGVLLTTGWRLTAPEWSSALVHAAGFLEETWSPEQRFPQFKIEDPKNPKENKKDDDDDGPKETT